MSAAHQHQRSETATKRHARTAREAELIAEAEAEADAGLLIPAVEVNAWIDSLGTAKERPLPQPAKPI
jgi:predicted transcriptional regulator